MDFLKIHNDDNVGVVLNKTGISIGEPTSANSNETNHVKFGKKVALTNIKKGKEILRYGAVIGIANKYIKAGSLVDHKNMKIPEAINLDKITFKSKVKSKNDLDSTLSFMGYRNNDGSVGTRNYLAISSTVQCVSGVVSYAADIIKKELLPHYPNVDGVVSLDHSYGCGIAINAKNASIPNKTISNLAKNPNFGGQVMFVGLGCEKFQKSMIDIKEYSFISLQRNANGGFKSMIDEILLKAEKHLNILNKRNREECKLSDLVIGVQCGGSDIFSGFTANPLIGKLSDLIVSRGGSIIFSEITEVRDAAEILIKRSLNKSIAVKLKNEFEWYDNYLAVSDVDRKENTTPGNIAGGISNIVEKAMGSVVKSGTSNISGVISAGDILQKKGLNFLAGPSSDFICGTLQMAAGANMHIFTTGRGTPYSLDGFPTIKVSSNNNLYEKWKDIIDFNAGVLVDGAYCIDDLSLDLLDLLLESASGKNTCAENLKISNLITLFNPAPIT